MLAGQFDGGLPPYIVRQATAGLTRSHYIEFPASSHLQLSSPTSSSDCARDIAGQFLAHPTQSLDTSCVASIPPLDITPTADLSPVVSARLLAGAVRPPGSATGALR